MSERLPSGGAVQDGSEHVLVVEDDEEIRAALAAGLTLAGYAVDQASNGQTALRQLEARRPALILLDFRLPDTDAATLVDDLRRRGLGVGVPIIAMSSDADFDLTANGIGANAYLRKPLRLPTLLQEIARLVG